MQHCLAIGELTECRFDDGLALGAVDSGVSSFREKFRSSTGRSMYGPGALAEFLAYNQLQARPDISNGAHLYIDEANR